MRSATTRKPRKPAIEPPTRAPRDSCPPATLGKEPTIGSTTPSNDTPTPLVTGEHRLRVRYEETDRAGVGYHANTFVWFECARTELLRSLGVPYRELEEAGWLLTVSAVDAKYHRSVFYDEELRIEVRIVSARGARLLIEYSIYGEGGDLRTTGSTELACCHTETGRPRRLPTPLLEAVGAIARESSEEAS